MTQRQDVMSGGTAGNGRRRMGEEVPLLASLEISSGTLRNVYIDDDASSSAETVRISHPLKRDMARQQSPTQNSSPREKRSSSGTVIQTALNSAKTCMGTGTLALPYAASQGGLLFNFLGLVLISLWNLYSVDRLLRCRELVPEVDGTEAVGQESRCARHRRTGSSMRKLFRGMATDGVHIAEEEVEMAEGRGPPPDGTATYGRVAWHALGPVGLHVMDTAMVILLVGVVTAYEDAIISFLRDTPLTTGSAALDSLWTVLIIAPLSCVPEMKYLSKFSAMGIFAIFFTFAVIVGYGVAENGCLTGFREVSWDDMWPQSFTGASNWFGVTVFGFGAVPITYNLQESMKEPRKMLAATEIALLLVCGTYVLISDGVAILFKPSVASFEGDVLQELPESWIPTVVRLTMTFVIIVSAPILVVPCAELIEGKIGLNINSKAIFRISVRFGICLFCTGVAFVVPAFVHVISFIGAFCVALTSFIFPPLLHLILLRKRKEEETGGARLIDSEDELARFDQGHRESKFDLRRMVIMDVLLLMWGIVATIVASILTFIDMVGKSRLQK